MRLTTSSAFGGAGKWVFPVPVPPYIPPVPRPGQRVNPELRVLNTAPVATPARHNPVVRTVNPAPGPSGRTRTNPQTRETNQ
jgi:hypothetical protein